MAPPKVASTAEAQQLFKQNVESLRSQLPKPYVAPAQATREDVQRYIRALEARERALDRHRATRYAENMEYVPTVQSAPSGFAPAAHREGGGRKFGPGFGAPAEEPKKTNRGGLCGKSTGGGGGGPEGDGCMIM